MQKTTLKSLLTIKNGVDYRNCGNGCVPVYGSGGYITSIDSFLYDGESILLPRKGTLENIMFVSGKFWTVDTIYWTIINTKLVDTYYLFNYLKMLDLSNFRTGTTLPSMTNNAYYGITVFLPSIAKQKDISVLLRNIDSKIDINNKINAELEATAKDLYNYWFVQFDFPDGNGRPYKSSGGKMVYNPILKREIPDGWTVECLAKNCLANILKPGIQVFEGEKIYLPTAAIEGDKIVDKTNVITYKNREGRANMQPVSNSIWFAKMKNTQKTLYFGEYSKENLDVLILSTGMCGVKCSKNALEYIWNFVNDCGFERIKNKLSHGATQEGINNDDLFYFPILVPTNDVLTAFSSLTNKLYMEKYSKEKENDSLVNLRDFLLPMLMNGQVSVE